MVTLHFKLLSPDGLLFDEQILQITARSTTGCFAIMANHVYYSAVIVHCVLELELPDHSRIRFNVPGGILEHRDNVCTVVCDGRVEKNTQN